MKRTATTSALLLVPLALGAACTTDGRVGTNGRTDGGGAGNGGNGGGGSGGSAGDAGGSKDAAPLGSWKGNYIDPALGGDVGGKFGGADDGKKPRVAYPLAESMHPINLSDITFQWSPGASTQKVFRLHFENARGSADFYFKCEGTSKCIQPMPEADWLGMAGANADSEVAFTISGTDGEGGTVGTTDPMTLRFSPEAVKGGLYYWSTELKGTYRLEFGAKKALPFVTPGTAANRGECGGCHSVSRNGKVITFTEAFAPFLQDKLGRLAIAPTADLSMPMKSPVGTETPDSGTMALNPDGSRVLVCFGGTLVLHDTADGSTLGTVSPSFLGKTGAAYFPEWSPDGENIAITLGPASGVEDFRIRSSEIAILPYAAGAFGAAKVIVPLGSDYHFYPSWSPDGKWIAFASAPLGLGSSSYDEPQARLRLVASDGGSVYELGLATQKVGLTSTWPKFTPFVQAGGDVIFLAFNSKMDYGFQLENSTMSGAAQRPQLWLFAIDLRRLASGDPSTAPVWLPFQDVTQHNHLPFWTERLGCGMGTAGSACSAGFTCRAGVCEPT